MWELSTFQNLSLCLVLEAGLFALSFQQRCHGLKNLFSYPYVWFLLLRGERLFTDVGWENIHRFWACYIYFMDKWDSIFQSCQVGIFKKCWVKVCLIWYILFCIQTSQDYMLRENVTKGKKNNSCMYVFNVVMHIYQIWHTLYLFLMFWD